MQTRTSDEMKERLADMSQSLTASGDGPGVPAPTAAEGVPSAGSVPEWFKKAHAAAVKKDAGGAGLTGDAGGTPVRRYVMKKRNGVDTTAPVQLKKGTIALLRKYFKAQAQAGECYEKMDEIMSVLVGKKLLNPGTFYYLEGASVMLVRGERKKCLALVDNFADGAEVSKTVTVKRHALKVWANGPKEKPGLVRED